MASGDTNCAPDKKSARKHIRLVRANDAAISPQDALALRETLQKHMVVQQNLCNAIEELADLLPYNVSPSQCLYVARALPAVMRCAHEFEENHIFPYLRTVAADDDRLAATLDRLHGEHWEDESYADELNAELLEFASQASHERATRLGYMMRGFFDSVRRHIAFEREHIVPILERNGGAA